VKYEIWDIFLGGLGGKSSNPEAEGRGFDSYMGSTGQYFFLYTMLVPDLWLPTGIMSPAFLEAESNSHMYSISQ
jgi:hypothetical protein